MLPPPLLTLIPPPALPPPLLQQQQQHDTSLRHLRVCPCVWLYSCCNDCCQDVQDGNNINQNGPRILTRGSKKRYFTFACLDIYFRFGLPLLDFVLLFVFLPFPAPFLFFPPPPLRTCAPAAAAAAPPLASAAALRAAAALAWLVRALRADKKAGE